MSQRFGTRWGELDITRFVLCWVVVVYHWPTFLQSANESENRKFDGLQFIFSHGWRAVDVFFCLSGFVFFCFFSSLIATGRLRLIDLFYRRVVKLYPVHLFALLCVTATLYYRATQGFAEAAYTGNTVYHFALHALFLNSLGLEKAPYAGFNAPMWSVSVEIALYITFYIFVKILPRKSWMAVCVVMVAAGVAIAFIYRPVGRGLIGFYLGGLVYLLHDKFSTRRTQQLFVAVVALTVAAWLLSLGITKANERYADAVWLLIIDPAVVLLGSNLCVGSVATAIAVRAATMTYPIYVWHFPCALAVVTFTPAGSHLRGLPLYLLAVASGAVLWTMVVRSDLVSNHLNRWGLRVKKIVRTQFSATH